MLVKMITLLLCDKNFSISETTSVWNPLRNILAAKIINNGSDEISICLWFSITSNAIAFLNFFENFKAYFLAIK